MIEYANIQKYFENIAENNHLKKKINAINMQLKLKCY